jgi:hypothetical protein
VRDHLAIISQRVGAEAVRDGGEVIEDMGSIRWQYDSLICNAASMLPVISSFPIFL